MKIFSLLVAAAALAAASGAALADPMRPTPYQRMYPYGGHGARRLNRPNGYRCKGISYGTGAQSCGTATGGPVGGINSRN